MAALTQDRNTPSALGDVDIIPVKASTKIFAGALVCRDANGWAVPGATATTLKAAGRAEEQVDNSAGGNGALTVKVRRGTFRYANSASSDEVVQADIGKLCYVVDDQTVAKTSGTNTRSAAGVVRGVDSSGVWVELGAPALV